MTPNERITEAQIKEICRLPDGDYPMYEDEFIPETWFERMRVKLFGAPDRKCFGWINIETTEDGMRDLIFTNGRETHVRYGKHGKAWTLVLNPKLCTIHSNCEQAISMWMHYHCYTSSGYNTPQRKQNAMNRVDDAYRGLSVHISVL